MAGEGQASLSPYQGRVGFLALDTPRWNREVISFVEASFIGSIPHYAGKKLNVLKSSSSQLTGTL